MRDSAKIKISVVGEGLPPDVLSMFQIAVDDAVRDVCEFLEFEIMEHIQLDFGRLDV